MSNRTRWNQQDDYETNYLHPRRAPRSHSTMREMPERSLVSNLLAEVTEGALRSAVFSIALALPSIRRTLIKSHLFAFLLGAIAMAVLIYYAAGWLMTK